jgi:hypothetical protein
VHGPAEDNVHAHAQQAEATFYACQPHAQIIRVQHLTGPGKTRTVLVQHYTEM